MADAVIEFPSGQIRQRLASAADQRLSGAFLRLRDGWKRDGGLTVQRRCDALDELARLLVKYQQPLVEAVSQDFGHRSPHETRLADIQACLTAIRHTRRHFQRWIRSAEAMAPVSPLSSRVRVERVPAGVVGIVSAWNHPVRLALVPLIAAIAAGNRVLLKPAEETPRTAAMLDRMLSELFEPAEVAVVIGGADMVQAVSRLALDHLLFAGPVAAGRQAMRAASDGLVPITLCTGGQAPAIVAPGFDLDDAAERIAIGKLFNAGQSGMAPDYALVPRGRELEFVDRFERAVTRLYPRLGSNPDYSAIINDVQYERLLSLIDDARRRGACARFINPAGEALEPARRKLAPTLLWQVPDGAAILSQQVSGPILPLLSYTTLEEAVVLVNSRPRPHGLHLFSRRRADVDFVRHHVRPGTMILNEALSPTAPDAVLFGGMGACHGEMGLRTFSRVQPLLEAPRFDLSRLIHPPYGDRIDRLLRWLSVR